MESDYNDSIELYNDNAKISNAILFDGVFLAYAFDGFEEDDCGVDICPVLDYWEEQGIDVSD